MPPIELVAERPADVSANADAFVRIAHPVIYVVTASDAYRDARCENRRSLIKLASILAHEESHLRDGTTERQAYEVQLMTLMRLGAGPESTLYRGVLRSMNVALNKKKPDVRTRPEGVLVRTN
jgi:hypothetical protein